MAEIRLNKLMRQFNIGLQDIVEFLRKQGADIDENPNAKVSDEYLPALQKQFGADLKAVEEANERAIKMSDILENSAKKKEEQLVEEEEEERVIVRSNTLSRKASAQTPAPAATSTRAGTGDRIRTCRCT